MKRAILVSALAFGLTATSFAGNEGDKYGPPQASQGTTSVTGVAGEQFGDSFGGQSVGSNVSGWSGGSFKGGSGPFSYGSADANGMGSGQANTGPVVQSSGKSNVQSIVFLLGPGQTEVAGGAAQGNWANTGAGSNFAGGFNQTSADYDGFGHGGSASGSANANGTTTAYTLQPNANMAMSGASTNGNSGAMLQGAKGQLDASGNGIIGGAAMVQQPNAYAGGNFTGTALYAGGSFGSLGINGNSSGQVGNGSVQANSHVDSTATAGGFSGSKPPSSCGCGH